MTIPWQPGYQGNMVVPPGYEDPHLWTAPAMMLLATTGPNGFALQNGTPTLLTWNAPADNQLHRVILVSGQNVSVAETGGAVGLAFTAPNGVGATVSVYAGGSGTGLSASVYVGRLVAPGSVVSLQQTAALTLGAAVVWAEIWGS